MKKEEILSFARKNWVPVLRDQSADVLCHLVKKYQPKKILEIGTCIGYSGILMLQSVKEANLITIEKDQEKAQKARQNFEEAGVSNRVNLICEDAAKAIVELKERGEKFDFIFLDGPKGQYIKYLPTLKVLLNKNGILFADDILYHGLVKKEGYPEHKHRTIVYRLREFIEKITTDPDFETVILEIEDGISISSLKSL